MIFFIMSAAVIIGLFLYFTLEPIDNVYRHGHVVRRGEYMQSRPMRTMYWIEVEGVDFEGNPARDFHHSPVHFNYKIGDAYPR